MFITNLEILIFYSPVLPVIKWSQQTVWKQQIVGKGGGWTVDLSTGLCGNREISPECSQYCDLCPPELKPDITPIDFSYSSNTVSHQLNTPNTALNTERVPSIFRVLQTIII